MRRIPLDRLLEPGDVLRVEDPTDSDHEKLLLFAGLKHNMLEIFDIKTGEHFATPEIPQAKKLFTIPSGMPRDPEKDLHQHHRHLRDALDLGLYVHYGLFYRSDAPPHDLHNTNLIIRQTLPSNVRSFRMDSHQPPMYFFNATFCIDSYDVVRVMVSGMQLRDLDRAGNLGILEKLQRREQRKLEDEDVRLAEEPAVKALEEKLAAAGVATWDLHFLYNTLISALEPGYRVLGAYYKGLLLETRPEFIRPIGKGENVFGFRRWPAEFHTIANAQMYLNKIATQLPAKLG